MAAIDFTVIYSRTPGSDLWVCADLSRPDSEAPAASALIPLSTYGALIASGEGAQSLRGAFSFIPSATVRSEAQTRLFLHQALEGATGPVDVVWVVNRHIFTGSRDAEGAITVCEHPEPLWRGSQAGVGGAVITIVHGPVPVERKPIVAAPRPAPAPEPETPTEPEPEPEPEPQPEFVPEPESPKRRGWSRGEKAVWIAVAVAAVLAIFLVFRACGNGSDLGDDAPYQDTVAEALTDSITDLTTADKAAPADTLPAAEAADAAPADAQPDAPAAQVPAPAAPLSSPSDTTAKPKAARDDHGANYSIPSGSLADDDE